MNTKIKMKDRPLIFIPLFILILSFSPSFSVYAQNNDQDQIQEEDNLQHSTIQSGNSFNGVKKFASNIWNLASALTRPIFNPNLTIPYFHGKILTDVPHVHARTPLGHTKFNREAVEKLTAVAKKDPNGLATFWLGPYPVLYVTSNDSRLKLVQESHVGITNQAAADHLQWMSGGNNVMGTFPDFRPINSKPYMDQRKFLMGRFFGNVGKLLPTVAQTTSEFLEDYCQQPHGQEPMPLRDFLTGLVLHTSSSLLGVNESTMDCGYFEDPEYRDVLNKVAHYGIAERGKPEFENRLKKVFLKIFKNNFDQISNETPKENLIRNIFETVGVDFPESVDDIKNIPENDLHTIAMNFASTGLGAMVHSTANTLDWALALLLKNPEKLAELTQLMADHKGLDLTDENLYQKGGEFFPLSEWVLHNVFLNPPFSHEFFLNQEALPVTLPDGKNIEVPAMSMIIVNYGACNRFNNQMTSAETFCEALDDEKTVTRFILDPRNASFGGGHEKKNKSRKCPGAKISLYEQMIMIATLLRDYDIEVSSSPSGAISCDGDPSMHPLCARINQGDIKIIPKKK